MGDRRYADIAAVLLLAAAICGAGTVSARAQQTPQRADQADIPSNASGASGVRGRSAADEVEDSYAAPGIPEPIPENDPTFEAEAEDGFAPVRRSDQRPIVQDGDLNTPAEPTQPVDGIIDVSEPLPPEDGTDPTVIDTRPPEDVAVFENPPAGFDPLLFQIEDLDPIRSNRATTRLFQLEPFDPVGIQVGSFVLFPEVETGLIWNSNLLRSPQKQSDIGYEVRPAARLVSNWARHALEFRTSGGLSFFDEFDSENEKSYLIETRGRLDLTRFTNVQALLSHEVSQESRSALDALTIGDRVDITTDRAEAALNHRFNRLRVQMRGSVADFAFGDTDVLGTTIANADRDYIQYEETIRGSWEFKPEFSLFTEVSVNQREYDSVAASDLINRSSDGQRYRAGVLFGNTGKILRGEVSLGWGEQTPDDKRLASVDGLLIDANATWRPTELTSVLFNARTDVAETTNVGVGGSFFRTAGVEVRHQLRTYLVATAGLTISTQDSQNGLIDDREIRSLLGLEYYVNRETVLYGRYTHTDLDSNIDTSDFVSDEIRVGVRLRR